MTNTQQKWYNLRYWDANNEQWIFATTISHRTLPMIHWENGIPRSTLYTAVKRLKNVKFFSYVSFKSKGVYYQLWEVS